MTASELRDWFAQAAPGERCRYYRGNLCWDRHRAAKDSEIVQLADTARSLGTPKRYYVHAPKGESCRRELGQGLAHLVQHRIAVDTYEYFIIKTRTPVLT